MPNKNLLTLLQRLRIENSGINEISTNLTDNGLKIHLRLGKGFENYESLRARPQNPNYIVGYTGMFSTVINTFLDKEFHKYVKNSATLTELKREIESRRKNPIVGYEELLMLQKEGVDYGEVENSFILISEIFKQKVKRLGNTNKT